MNYNGIRRVREADKRTIYRRTERWKFPLSRGKALRPPPMGIPGKINENEEKG